MQLADSDLAAIRKWATAHDEITGVWLYGRRARNDNRDDSDIDLAIATMGSTVGERLACWMGADWRAKLKLSCEVHLEWYDPNARMDRVGPGVEREGVCLYRRDTTT